jgi:hypothetical protein
MLTVCFIDLDQGSRMIILISTLATFKAIARIIVEAAWAVSKIGLSLKSKHHKLI